MPKKTKKQKIKAELRRKEFLLKQEKIQKTAQIQTKIKISEAQKGRTGHWLGKKHKKESIIKMQKPKKDGFNIGRKVTWNTRPDTKKVIQKSLNGDVIKIWDSASKIKNELNIMVYDALEKRNKTAGGFCWDWA